MAYEIEPPQLSHIKTVTQTIQHSGSCGRHAVTRVLIKNVFEQMLHLKLSPDEEQIYSKNNCNDFLDILNFLEEKSDKYKKTKQQIQRFFKGQLSNKTCSPTGYRKILLLLYCYYSISNKIGYCGGTTIHETLKQFIDDVVYTRDVLFIPRQLKNYEKDVTVLLTSFKNKINNNFVYYSINIQIQPNMNSVPYGLNMETIWYIINICIQHKFYILLGLTNNSNSEHAVTIVGYIDSPNKEERKLIIKNSWGEFTNIIPFTTNNFTISGVLFCITDFDLFIPSFKNVNLFLDITNTLDINSNNQIIIHNNRNLLKLYIYILNYFNRYYPEHIKYVSQSYDGTTYPIAYTDPYISRINGGRKKTKKHKKIKQ